MISHPTPSLLLMRSFPQALGWAGKVGQLLMAVPKGGQEQGLRQRWPLENSSASKSTSSAMAGTGKSRQVARGCVYNQTAPAGAARGDCEVVFGLWQHSLSFAL